MAASTCSCESARAVRACASYEPGALGSLDPQLVPCRDRHAQSRAGAASGHSMIHATTTLTLTVSNMTIRIRWCSIRRTSAHGSSRHSSKERSEHFLRRSRLQCIDEHVNLGGLPVVEIARLGQLPITAAVGDCAKRYDEWPQPSG
jgi:hypothetical protein